MSIEIVRQLLETALDGIAPSLATSWENRKYDPVADTPYQEVHLLPAEPENPTIGGSFYRENGIFQVTLKYPSGTGPAATAARVGLLRGAFARGNTFTKNGVTVVCARTPEILPYYIDQDRYCVPVRVRYYANIST